MFTKPRSWNRCLVLAAVAVALLAGRVAPAARAQMPLLRGGPLQFYSQWQDHASGQYRFTKYYFKKNPGDAKYSLHYVIHRHGEPWMYYFNPVKKVYWCRALVDQKGKASKIWIVLADKDKRERLDQIPEATWQQGTLQQPFVPGTKGPFLMLPPPPPPKGPILLPLVN